MRVGVGVGVGVGGKENLFPVTSLLILKGIYPGLLHKVLASLTN